MDNFLVFADAYTGLLVRMDQRTYSFTGIQMVGSANPVALAFNPADRRLYFTEVNLNPGSQIFSAGIDAGNPVMLKQLPQGTLFIFIFLKMKEVYINNKADNGFYLFMASYREFVSIFNQIITFGT